jgi:hypothetical protein
MSFDLYGSFNLVLCSNITYYVNDSVVSASVSIGRCCGRICIAGFDRLEVHSNDRQPTVLNHQTKW